VPEAVVLRNVDLNLLKTFQQVVNLGSFSKAAARLRQPKSRVSRHISALERELGIQLIYRTTRQFRLTPAGENLAQRALPLLDDLSNTLEAITSESDEIAGPLRISVPDDIGVELMGKICHGFLALYPKVRIELNVSNLTVDLVKDSIDMALRIGELTESTLIQKKIGNVALALVCSPELLKRCPTPTELEDLAKVPYLAFSTRSGSRITIRGTRGKESRSLTLEPSFICNNFFVLRSMALEGQGVALVPKFLVQEAIRDQSLIPLLHDWSIEGSPVRLVMPHQKAVPPRVRKFAEFLSKEICARLDKSQAHG
jgi:DNA-binding transcriptional LysR family regulator